MRIFTIFSISFFFILLVDCVLDGMFTRDVKETNSLARNRIYEFTELRFYANWEASKTGKLCLMISANDFNALTVRQVYHECSDEASQKGIEDTILPPDLVAAVRRMVHLPKLSINGSELAFRLGRCSSAEFSIMVEELRIEYDHNPPVYFPGKSLKGRLVIAMSKPCNVDAVKMYCLGEAFTRKVEARNRTSIGKFVLNAYTAKEQFFHLFTELVSPDVGSTANGKIDKLFLQQAGEHSFPFEFHLPPDCPQSFESNSGSIRYSCKAEVHRQDGDDKSARKVAKRLFTVLNGIDLNVQARQESFSSEMQFSDSSHHHFVCRLQVPNVRVVPGEPISTKLKVIHVGKKEHIKEVVVQFVQKASYVGYKAETKEPTFWEERRVLQENATKQKPDEKNGTTTTLHWDAVQVPPTAPTIDCGCALLRVQYELLYHLTTAKNQQQTFVVPIVVGIVPPRKRWPLFMSNRNVDRTSEARRQIIEPLINNYDDMPFPSIKEQHASAQDVRSEDELNHLPDPIYFKPYTVVYRPHTAETIGAKQELKNGGGIFSLRWRKAQSIPVFITAEYR